MVKSKSGVSNGWPSGTPGAPPALRAMVVLSTIVLLMDKARFPQ